MTLIVNKVECNDTVFAKQGHGDLLARLTHEQDINSIGNNALF